MNQEKIKALEETITSGYSNITGMVILKNGVKSYEKYFNGYSADHAVHVYSVTKSIISALIGIAIDKHYIKSTDQKILDFFPDYKIISGEKTIQNITIKNMLTMTAPYKYKTEPYETFFSSNNPIKDALDLLGGKGKIGDFLYAAIGGTHILSGILVKATGRPVREFAVEHLFSPLGIHVTHDIKLHTKEEHIAKMGDKNTSGWAVDPQGINTAGWGLFLTPVEMVKIGQLYMNNGAWEGRQIIPSAWIAESTKEHSRWESLNLSYGYLWWVIDEKEQTYAAIGDGGNVIYVNAHKKMVISIASLFTADVKDRIEFIKAYVEAVL